MILEIPKDFKPTNPIDADLLRRSGNSKSHIDHDLLSFETLQELQAWLKGKAEYRGILNLLSSLIAILTNPNKAKVANLKLLPDAIKKHLETSPKGWLYKVSKQYSLPLLITAVTYHINRDERPYVTLEAVFNHLNKFHRITISFDSDDIVKKGVAQVLADKNLFLPTSEYDSDYDQHLRLYNDWRIQVGRQFRASGLALTYHEKSYNRERVFFNEETRLVNNEDIEQETRLAAHNHIFEDRNEVPTHCYLKLFDLHHHHDVIAHVGQLQPYAYNKEVLEKLILPPDHARVIQTLTGSIVATDFIEGKSGGTHVLLLGKPGLGKTTTAEVFSEITERPLYRIQSGQLGTAGPEVENNLKTIFERAERWNAICLFDEADVVIQERGHNLEQNAVVAGILRAMEYTKTTAFWTSNRATVIDDAIFSRCIAIIKYEGVQGELKRKLWETLSKQFNISLDSILDELLAAFPEASGRDIKMLLLLVKRHIAQHNLPLSFDVFMECAAVRGLI